jgi:ubiquinone/menaquinone biosynthesis C-methylase UbiE
VTIGERLLHASAITEEVPERFDPATMTDQLTAAEHLARYRWASGIVAGRRVLDAGCGTAYGSALLAEAGAQEVVGIDLVEDVLIRATSRMPASVTLQTADVTALPFADGSFDVVVCFEVIEHLNEPELALNEFRRVLTEEGVLAVSSPNRDVYPAGNPHHVHEYTPAELEEALTRRFAHTRVERQHTWISSGVFPDADFSVGDDGELKAGLHVRKLASDKPGAELYTVALASQQPLPAVLPTLELAVAVELRKWDRLWHEQAAVLEQQARILTEHEQSYADYEAHSEQWRTEVRELRRQLGTAERALGRVPELQAQVEELVLLNEDLLATVTKLSKREEDLDELVEIASRYTVLVESTSWNLTRPLRAFAATLRKLRR